MEHNEKTSEDQTKMLNSEPERWYYMKNAYGSPTFWHLFFFSFLFCFALSSHTCTFFCVHHDHINIKLINEYFMFHPLFMCAASVIKYLSPK